MFVIEVIPLSRGSHMEALSYYSSTPYETGMIITVPIRNKQVRGIVTDLKPVGAAKTAVRAATFTLKKLPEQTSVQPLPPVLIESAKRLQKRIPAKLGALLYALLPAEVREGRIDMESNLPCIGEYESPAVSLLLDTEEERYRIYQSRIREAFAHRGSVLFVVPTSAHVALAVERLSQGIEDRVVSFSPTYTQKKLDRSYEAFHDLSRAKLIITTPSHIFIDRHDFTSIIIEQSRSQHYRSRMRPYLDSREVLQTVAKVTGRHVLMGDLLPSTEDEYHRREDHFLTEGEFPKRVTSLGSLSVIKQTDKPKPDVPFELISTKLQSAITETLSKRKNVFLYAARRGIAPVVVCIDCGHIFRCPDSGAPYSLFRTFDGNDEQRWFLSTTSGKRIKAPDTCPKCGSWRLKERGVGIQHIHDEITALYPNKKIILFDHTTAKTFRKATVLMNEFMESKGAILLGTAMALPYLEKPVETAAIVSLDATRAIPTWRADEELFSLLLSLRERTTGTTYVQTREGTDDILTYAKSGLVEQFYTEELELREALKYPPFAVFIHLTIAGTQDSVQNTEVDTLAILAGTPCTFYNAPHTTVGKVVRYGLLRIPATDWPHEVLIDKLRSLPPSVRIEINPSRIV